VITTKKTDPNKNDSFGGVSATCSWKEFNGYLKTELVYEFFQPF
jgi:hypothetical protein